jgi:hypothetical protein
MFPQYKAASLLKNEFSAANNWSSRHVHTTRKLAIVSPVNLGHQMLSLSLQKGFLVELGRTMQLKRYDKS